MVEEPAISLDHALVHEVCLSPEVAGDVIQLEEDLQTEKSGSSPGRLHIHLVREGGSHDDQEDHESEDDNFEGSKDVLEVLLEVNIVLDPPCSHFDLIVLSFVS